MKHKNEDQKKFTQILLINKFEQYDFKSIEKKMAKNLGRK